MNTDMIRCKDCNLVVLPNEGRRYSRGKYLGDEEVYFLCERCHQDDKRRDEKEV